MCSSIGSEYIGFLDIENIRMGSRNVIQRKAVWQTLETSTECILAVIAVRMHSEN